MYIHIPFCNNKCGYCDFYSRLASRDIIDAYADALVNALRSYGGEKGFSSVYIGGGTPSLLNAEQLERILNECFSLGADANGEITVEVNPEDVSRDFCRAVKQIGFTRISVGIQSFNDAELHALGRGHTAKQGRNAVECLSEFFDNVSLDLMLGTLGQTEQSLSDSLDVCTELGLPHISAYLMKVYEKTLFARNGVREADDELSEKLYLQTDSFLSAHGYSHYEISSFCRDGRYSHHNMLYWQGGEYAAFGSGACGFENGVRYRIPSNAELFIKTNGNPEPIIEEIVSPDSAKNEKIIFGLRTSSGVEISDLPADSGKFIDSLVKNGLAVSDGCVLRLTPKGWLVSNEIITLI